MEQVSLPRYTEPQTVLTVEDMRESDAACIGAGTPGTGTSWRPCSTRRVFPAACFC